MPRNWRQKPMVSVQGTVGGLASIVISFDVVAPKCGP